MNNIELKKMIINDGALGERKYSLANNVFEYDDWIIKIIKSPITYRNEITFLELLGREHFHFIDKKIKYLVIKKIEGSLKNKEEIDQLDFIKKVLKKKDELNDLNRDEVESLSLFDRFSDWIPAIYKYSLDKDIRFNILEIFEKISDLPTDTISHWDLNAENILFDDRDDIHFIDFEWAKLTSKYSDWITIIIEWDIKPSIIRKIVDWENLDYELLKQMCILWAIRNFLINKKMYDKTNDIKFLEKSDFFERRINELIDFCNRHNSLLIGTYDMVHVGHINLMYNASKEGNVYVAVTSDRMNKNNPSKPDMMMDEVKRRDIIESIEFVDKAIIFDYKKINDLQDVVDLYKIDQLVYGSDYKNDDKKKGLANKVGVKLRFFPRTKTISSTELREISKNYEG